MKRHFTALCLIILFLLNVQSVLSQNFREGYVVLHSSDTLKGLIKAVDGNRSYSSCEYKTNLSDASKTYTTVNATAYQYTGGKSYQLKNIKQENGNSISTFMEVLVSGTATLYKYQSSFYIEKGEEFYELKTERISTETSTGGQRELIKKRYIGVLSFLMSDCNKIQDRIQSTSLNANNLIRTTTQYNQCTSPLSDQNNSKTKNSEWYKVSPAIYSGYTFSKAVFDFVRPYNRPYLEESPLVGNFGFPIGLSVGLSAPRVSTKASIITGLMYKNTKYHLMRVEKSSAPNVNTLHDANINFHRLEFLLGLKYNLAEKGPYLTIGASKYIIAKHNTVGTSEKRFFDTNEVLTNDQELFYFKKFNISVWGSIGFNLIKIGEIDTFLELRYSISPGGIVTNKTTVKDFSIVLGARLNK